MGSGIKGRVLKSRVPGLKSVVGSVSTFESSFRLSVNSWVSKDLAGLFSAGSGSGSKMLRSSVSVWSLSASSSTSIAVATAVPRPFFCFFDGLSVPLNDLFPDLLVTLSVSFSRSIALVSEDLFALLKDLAFLPPFFFVFCSAASVTFGALPDLIAEAGMTMAPVEPRGVCEGS